MKYKFKIHGFCVLFLLPLLVTSCKKLVEIPPPDTEIVRESVFNNDNTALSALLGIYNKLVTSSSFDGGSLSLTVTEGLYADELMYYGSPAYPIAAYYLNSIDPVSSNVSSIWSGCYNMIYSTNAVIEGLKASPNISMDVRNQLMGEALFMRAFLHFYLVNLFGAVPYIRTTDYTANAKVSRTPVDDVYAMMIEDLLEAKTYLKNEYPSAYRVRVNKGAATALLARVYLYNKDWVNAEAQATEVINNTTQYALLPDLNQVFLKESKEIIWQLIPTYGYTKEGALFILLAPPTVVALRNDLVNAFETGDLRKRDWTDSLLSPSGLTKWFFPVKYKNKNVNNNTEYSVLMRVAELYLIRAEARAEQNRLTGVNSAAADINTIRGRANLGPTTAATQAQWLAAIEKERRAELFTEWGHRFFDLKRRGRLDAVLGPVKPNWKTTAALLPIPQSEILANPHLDQNPGY